MKHSQQSFIILSRASRYENVQKGEGLRQFHQYGVENVWLKEPTMDAEVISCYGSLEEIRPKKV